MVNSVLYHYVVVAMKILSQAKNDGINTCCLRIFLLHGLLLHAIFMLLIIIIPPFLYSINKHWHLSYQ